MLERLCGQLPMRVSELLLRTEVSGRQPPVHGQPEEQGKL
jgi:hypothetical protein